MAVFMTHHSFTAKEANLIVATLNQHSNCRALAAQITAKYEADRLDFDDAEDRRAAVAQLTAAVAKAHKLTPRQVEALAAVRAGHTPFHWWYGTARGWYMHGSSMGGAKKRMVQNLQLMGFLDDNRKLTPAGAAKLAEREARFKPRWPIPTKENA